MELVFWTNIIIFVNVITSLVLDLRRKLIPPYYTKYPSTRNVWYDEFCNRKVLINVSIFIQKLKDITLDMMFACNDIVKILS